LARERVYIKLIILLVVVLFSGCATPAPAPIEGINDRTFVSPTFDFRPGMRAAVLPFTVLGHPEHTQDVTEADILSVKLAEAGFKIIDSTIFYRHDLELNALIPMNDLEAIRLTLDIELLAIGTINYRYKSSQSLLSKGRLLADSASVRLVSLSTGEVFVIATVRAVEGSFAAAMGESIKLALGQQ
jgi:hypothetical protein